LRQRVTRNVNEMEKERQTFADRLADGLSTFSGSWTFMLITVAYISFWILYVGRGLLLYSFTDSMGLLDAVNGIIAALLTPIILLSQNRQENKDRLRSDMDFQVNLKNELALNEVMRRLDVLESERLPVLFSELRKEIRGL
jgi:uncharacterized membrane protein